MFYLKEIGRTHTHSPQFFWSLTILKLKPDGLNWCQKYTKWLHLGLAFDRFV